MDNKCYCSPFKTLDKYLILCYNKYRELSTAIICCTHLNLQAAQLQIGNMSQTANIINAIRPFSNPAYVVGSPYGTNTANCGCGM